MAQSLPLRFVKMHGLGNDFVVLDMRGFTQAEVRARLPLSQIRLLANRRLGVGCDQVLVMCDAEARGRGLLPADAGLVLYNADGSDCGACGNGTRCVGALLLDESGRDDIVLETALRTMQIVRRGEDRVSVDMGPPQFEWSDIPLTAPRNTLALEDDFGLGPHKLIPAQAVGMGNPHLVLFVKDAEKIDLAALGARLEYHPLFPQRTNVEFVSVTAPGHLRLRVWERGTGQTLACGTAACATAVAAIRAGLVEGRAVSIRMDGGTAQLSWDAPVGDKQGAVWLTGPTAHVYAGQLPDGFWQEAFSLGKDGETLWPTARKA